MATRRAPLRAGDLCHHGSSSYPVYTVICVNHGRAWVRDISSGVEAIVNAIRVIGGSLRTAVNEPDELSPRVAMAWGSLLAGMAFGTGGTHLSHALQYPVGAATKTAHGLGTGLLLPYVMQACLPGTVGDLAAIAAALGCGGAGAESDARSAVEAVRALAANIGIPPTLDAIGVERGQLDRFAELALGVTRLAGNAALPPTRPLFDAILGAAFSGDRSVLPQ